ncbi:MAG: VOC family protein, partial [Chloroflexi bacterium]|nr:VOC family protein [Chloroflexota bacterium]
NYRVDNLKELLKVLKEEGCQVDDRVEETEQGIFGWMVDPEGNLLELWQPPV